MELRWFFNDRPEAGTHWVLQYRDGSTRGIWADIPVVRASEYDESVKPKPVEASPIADRDFKEAERRFDEATRGTYTEDRKTEGLTFRYLRQQNIARCRQWHKNVEPWSVADWIAALVGELGEAANKMKKLRRHQQGLTGNKPGDDPKKLQADIAEELADVQLYLDLLAAELNINLGAAVVKKFNKVSDELGFPQRLDP